jgi:hypothetical protein
LNAPFVEHQCLKTPEFVQTRALKPIKCNIMKQKFIKFFLTLLFGVFALRQIMVYNELPTAIFLLILSMCVALANDN